MLKKIVICLSLLAFSSTNCLVSFKSAQDVASAGVEFVECAFVDLHGNLKTVTIPTCQLSSAIKHGLYFDSSSVPGCSTINNSDMHLKLDLTSCVFLPEPLRERKTIMVMCDIGISSAEPYEACSRTLLKKQSQKLAELSNQFDLNLQLNMGAELEFFVIDKKNECIDNDKYFDASTNSNTENCKQLLLSTLLKAGIDAEKIHHEVAPGQYEVTFKYGNSLQTADTIIFSKYIIRSLVKQSGDTAIFMPKPFSDENGSGMHVHYSLYDTISGKNIFCTENDPAKLSNFTESFLAGNLKYMLEVSALLNSSINSFKRLVKGFEAPVYVCWGIKNRSALIRIPLVGEDHTEACRAELRCPDASCNPYLAFAAISATGCKGVQDQLVIPNPVTGNLYKLTLDQIKRIGITCLPSSLEEALTHLNNSSFVEEFLGKKLLNEFVTLKTKEVDSFNNRHNSDRDNSEITEWELERYI